MPKADEQPEQRRSGDVGTLGNYSARHGGEAPMSRTYHHSRRHGRDHRWASRPDRCGYGGSREASESPNWYSHLHNIRPGRHHDRHVARLIIKGDLDPVEAVFPYTGTRRPHEYYW